VAAGIWKRVEDFAAYSYCKAHATTYGHISYQAAYLKAHHPAEFLAAVIANKAGFYDARAYLEEARRFNVRILPPCVNRSGVECRPEGGGRRRGPEGAIRPGLESVRSLSGSTVKRLLRERRRGPFDSLEDFHTRVHPGREELENLILCGAFDSLGPNRPTLLLKMEGLPARPGKKPEDTSRKHCLFRTGPPPVRPVRVPLQPPYPLRERILWELRTLGFSHSGHPLEAWDGRLRELQGVPSFKLHGHAGRRVTFVGWLVTTRRAVTKNREYMKFVTLEDRHGVVEVVLFPEVYRRCGARITGAGCYLAEGRVEEQHGAVNLVADGLEPVPLD
jgi:DNA polymerase III alpha subunit